MRDELEFSREGMVRLPLPSELSIKMGADFKDVIDNYKGDDSVLNKLGLDEENVLDLDRTLNVIFVKINRRSKSRHFVAIPRLTDFNSSVTMDLKEFGNRNVLWIVSAFIRMIKRVVLKDKRAEQYIVSGVEITGSQQWVFMWTIEESSEISRWRNL